MNIEKKFTNQSMLFGFAFLLALSFRVLLLDTLLLNEFEAKFSYQSHQIANGLYSPIEDNASYVLITSFLFMLFGSSSTLARLLPAILGSFVVFIPYLFRKSLPQWAGVIAAFALAIDPGLVPLSRVAGGSGSTIGFIVLFLLFLQMERFNIAGVLFALILFSGSSAYIGTIILLGLWLVNKIFGSTVFPNIENFPTKEFFTNTAFTIIIFGSYFLQYPAGISSVFSGLGALFSSSIPLSFNSIFQGLFLTNPLFWLVTIILVMDTIYRKNESYYGYSFFIVSSLASITFIPNENVNNLPWLIIPSLMVFSIFISKFIGKGNLVNWGKTSIVLMFLTYFWINLQQLGNLFINSAIHLSELPDFLLWAPEKQNYLAQLVIVSIIPVIILFTTYLFSTTWPRKYAIQGLVWGTSIFLFFFMFGSSIRASFYHQYSANQLWSSNKGGGNINIAIETIERISELNFGTRNFIDIQNQTNLSSIDWALRNFPNSYFGTSVDVSAPPTIVITSPEVNDTFLQSIYRGTAFAWQISPAWQGSPPSIAKWITIKEAPTVNEQLILWVRADAFPDGDITEIISEAPLLDND
jgi:hypothetical protein